MDRLTLGAMEELTCPFCANSPKHGGQKNIVGIGPFRGLGEKEEDPVLTFMPSVSCQRCSHYWNYEEDQVEKALYHQWRKEQNEINKRKADCD